jgi:hypothetical protein
MQPRSSIRPQSPAAARPISIMRTNASRLRHRFNQA